MSGIVGASSVVGPEGTTAGGGSPTEGVALGIIPSIGGGLSAGVGTPPVIGTSVLVGIPDEFGSDALAVPEDSGGPFGSSPPEHPSKPSDKWDARTPVANSHPRGDLGFMQQGKTSLSLARDQKSVGRLTNRPFPSAERRIFLARRWKRFASSSLRFEPLFALLRGLAMLAVTLLAGISRASGGGVLLASDDLELARALPIALGEPVVVQTSGAPVGGDASANARARGLALLHGVNAVVWFDQAGRVLFLLLYDGRTDQLVTRRLESAPPFDEATAAAVALAIKTELRNGKKATSPQRKPRRRASSAVPRLSVVSMVGAREATSPDSVEPRAGVGVMLWPAWLENPRLGLGLEIASGVGVGIDTADFRGRLIEAALLASVLARWRLGSSFDVTLAPAVGGDMTHLNGKLRSPAEPTRVVRLNLVAAAHGELGLRLGSSLRPGLRLGVIRPLTTQAYEVRREPLLRIEPLAWHALLVAEIALD